MADPAYFDVPLAGLLSQSFADERRALIDPEQAQTTSWPRVTRPTTAARRCRRRARALAGGEAEGPLRSTTHLTVADAEGTVVAYTFTIESTGGNGIVVPGWGFLLNNELTDFDYTTPTAANAPDGGKRPRSSIAPTIVQEDGEPVLAVGLAGRLDDHHDGAQMLLERLDFGKSLPDAIATPRAAQRNSTNGEDVPTTQAEPAFIASPEGQLLASDYGHVFVTPSLDPPVNGEIGAATGIDWLADGRLQAAAEPVRRGGGGAGVVDPG